MTLNGKIPKEVNTFGERRRRRADGLAMTLVSQFVLDTSLSGQRVCMCVCDVLQISPVFASVASCLGFTIDDLLWAFAAHIIENALKTPELNWMWNLVFLYKPNNCPFSPEKMLCYGFFLKEDGLIKNSFQSKYSLHSPVQETIE